MAAFKLKHSIDQGSTYDKLITWWSQYDLVNKVGITPVDLTGCTAKSHFRSDIDSPDVLLELSTANGRIELGGTAGTVRWLIDAATTAAMDWTDAVHDLEITFADGTVQRKFAGTVTVSKEVTRP